MTILPKPAFLTYYLGFQTFSSADEELFSEMAIQDITIGIDCF
jgi:hypothetical protein